METIFQDEVQRAAGEGRTVLPVQPHPRRGREAVRPGDDHPRRPRRPTRHARRPPHHHTNQHHHLDRPPDRWPRATGWSPRRPNRRDPRPLRGRQPGARRDDAVPVVIRYHARWSASRQRSRNCSCASTATIPARRHEHRTTAPTTSMATETTTERHSAVSTLTADTTAASPERDAAPTVRPTGRSPDSDDQLRFIVRRDRLRMPIWIVAVVGLVGDVRGECDRPLQHAPGSC